MCAYSTHHHQTVYCVKEESPGHWSTYSDGSAVKTGAKIALRHLPSKRFLTSHQYRSPLTNQQEVCGAGDESVNERNPMLGSFAIWKVRFRIRESTKYITDNDATHRVWSSLMCVAGVLLRESLASHSLLSASQIDLDGMLGE